MADWKKTHKQSLRRPEEPDPSLRISRIWSTEVLENIIRSAKLRLRFLTISRQPHRRKLKRAIKPAAAPPRTEAPEAKVPAETFERGKEPWRATIPSFKNDEVAREYRQTMESLRKSSRSGEDPVE